MSTINIGEVYYLVRIGTWSPEDLERWVQKRISTELDQATADFYEKLVYEKYSDQVLAQGNQTRWVE